ncbi:unnamed protein product [Brassica rapa subsp. trilocularis]
MWLLDAEALLGEYAVELGLDDISLPSPDMCAFFYFHANAMAEFQNVPITNGVNVSKVELFPFNATVNDNPVFRITAVTPKSIASATTVSASMVLEGESELLQSSRRGYELCDCTNHCPVAPGGFELVFPHPYWRYKIKPGRYRVHVRMINQKNVFQEKRYNNESEDSDSCETSGNGRGNRARQEKRICKRLNSIMEQVEAEKKRGEDFEHQLETAGGEERFDKPIEELSLEELEEYEGKMMDMLDNIQGNISGMEVSSTLVIMSKDTQNK